MAQEDPRFWREYKDWCAAQARERLVRQADGLIACQQANDQMLAASLPEIRDAVRSIWATLIDTSELSYADYAELRALCLKMAALFGAFQNELAVFHVG